MIPFIVVRAETAIASQLPCRIDDKPHIQMCGNINLATLFDRALRFAPTSKQKNHKCLFLAIFLLQPHKYNIHTIYPNPFNLITSFRYKLRIPGDVTIEIFDLNGVRIRSVPIMGLSAGVHSFTWNSTNDLGEKVPSGVYFYLVSSADIIEMKKMILIK